MAELWTGYIWPTALTALGIIFLMVAIILSVPVEIDAQLVAARLARHPAVRSIHAQEIEEANPADLSPMAA